MESFPRKPRSRVLHSQAEADAEIAAVMRAIREAVQRLVEAHAAAGRASQELVEANRLVTASELVEREQVVA